MGADIFTMGYDWAGRLDDLIDICEIGYLPRTTGTLSTDLKIAISGQIQSELGAMLTEIRTLEMRIESLLK
jgi:glycerol-3-phosphate cytidylyltransferase